MDMDEIKLELGKEKLVSRKAEFTGFVCPQCGEISETIMKLYSKELYYIGYVDKDGHQTEVRDEEGDLELVDWHGDCMHDIEEESDKYIVKVSEKNGEICVELMSNNLSDDDIDDLIELIEDRYDGKITIILPSNDALKNWVN